MAKEWREGKTSAQRGYGHKWRKERARWLKEHPLCVYCNAQGRITPATVVDHIKPHNGDQRLFWSRSNWQSLCKLHHDSTKQHEERTGKRRPVIGLDGYPVNSDI
ncbi:hypothetical protein BHC44_09700 [Snodgrassella alvi]|jgi:5-methylcytosine-specific restriction enzyme A|nr:hypothetical protein BHC44_09700 [Snodgrassella alvi]